jgi:type IV pilus assembly protein PilV
MKVLTTKRQQCGVMLLEVLIAILIFAVGILGIVGLQATAVKQVTDARFRSDAALLANQLVGTMWVSDRSATTLQNSFATGQAAYTTWAGTTTTQAGTVMGTLPGVTDYPPTVDINSAGVATISIYWRAPSEAAGTTPHKHVVVAQIK